MDECVEEFALEVNQAKEGLVLDSAKEGIDVNLQEDLSLEQQAALKEGVNTA